MKVSIAKQLWLICFAYAIILTGTGFGSYLTAWYLNNQLENTENVQMKAIRNMTLADMMHDGMRGVVTESLVTANEKNAKILEDLEKEISKKGDSFNNILRY